MSMVTQSNPGSEKFGIANAHTMLHQWYDPALQVLPHGVPNLIYQLEEDFGAFDFKPFSDRVQHCYNELGCPLVTRHTVWEVYLCLLGMLQVHDEIPHHIDQFDDIEEDLSTLPLLEDHDKLLYCKESNGAYYMGGVGGGLGLGIKHLNQLEGLTHDDEPEITLSIDENIGLDHAGLVMWEFLDGSNPDDMSDIPDADW
ncbi:hypothetical protein BDR05DRAFT_944937 [Suillus weaverae]|nr:hypothetical protein BDR05DRAFT_944937 [Suillus weaverae]